MRRETSPAGGRCLRGPTPTCSGYRMAAAYCCLSLFFLSTWVALLLQPLQGAWGAPLEPMYPGDYASPEQMAQYATQLRRYINTQTRPRELSPVDLECPACFLPVAVEQHPSSPFLRILATANSLPPTN